MPGPKRILDIGQCGVDGPRIARFLTQQFGVTVDRAGTKAQALSMAAEKPYDLVLVNRLLDRDRSAGLEVIQALKHAHPQLRVMLVSNLPDAQEEAMKLGALRGFGKAQLDMPETEEFLCGILCQEPP